MKFTQARLSGAILLPCLTLLLVPIASAQGIQFELPDFDEIEKSVEEFNQEMKDNPRYQHEKKGYRLLNEGRTAEAVVEFDAAIRLDPGVHTVHAKKGIALLQLGRAQEALASLDKSMAVYSGSEVWNWWPQYYRGIALGALGRFDDSSRALGESLRLNPRSQTYILRAQVRMQMRQPRAALADVNAALGLNPGNDRFRQMAVFLSEQVVYQDFWQQMAGLPGAQPSTSGLIYFASRDGSGQQPTAADTVRVHYHGTLIDGTVFDSSRDRGQAVSFPLARVIPCWTEGLQKMKVGGSGKLVCPAQIAYGERGVGDRIKPGATLVFEVELLAIE